MSKANQANEGLQRILCALTGFSSLLGGFDSDARISGTEIQGLAVTLDALILQEKSALIDHEG